MSAKAGVSGAARSGMGNREPKKHGMEIVDVDGHPYVKGQSRVLGYVSLSDPFVNAKALFSKLSRASQKGLHTGFTKWIQRVLDTTRHHGWSSTQHGGKYTNCYVFKHVGEGQRLYGFVAHPTAEPRMEMCCLVHSTTKHENETDVTILAKVEEVRSRTGIVEAVNHYWTRVKSKSEEQK